MRRLPEEHALLETAVTALANLLSPLLVQLIPGKFPAMERLRIGQYAEFCPLVQPGWSGWLTNGETSTAGQVLVVPYVSAAQGAQLRARGICYLDRAGNAWLTDMAHATAVLVQGQARPPAARPPGGALFGKAGVQLLYTLLSKPVLIRETYRTIATQSQLPVATVGRLLLQLQAQGYLVSETPRQLVQLLELRRRWVAAYGEVVRPQLVASRYRWLEPARARGGWQELVLPPNTRWGGEPAAHLLLDGYLLPQDFTLYTTALRGELMRALRLVPDPNGAVQTLAPLAEETIVAPRPDCVAPLLVYADLLLSGDPRNREVAEMLYAHYLEHSA